MGSLDCEFISAMKLLNSLIFAVGCLSESRSRRSHTSGTVTHYYTGSYLRGVTVSISGADPNPDTGAARVKVKQTYSFRRDLAGFGTYSGGCWDSQLGKKSGKIGPVDKLNTQKYHKALAYFQDEKATDLSEMMDRWGPYDDWSIRVGDAKEVLEWKIRYYLREIENTKAYDHDNYCLGDVEDIIEASDQITEPTSFLFRNRIEGGTNWMVIVGDSDTRTVSYGTRGGAAVYEKYKFGAAMFDINPRADTGTMNNSPVATLPGEFLMPSNCASSYKIDVTDPDGDQIRCRFAFGEETSELAARNRDVRGEMVTDFPSITLDEETCTVTYDGNLDNICTGEFSQTFEHKSSRGPSMKYAGSNHCYKPFAIIVEDFDTEGNVLSSIPITFFGQVVEAASVCPGETDYKLTKDEIVTILENKVVAEPVKEDHFTNGTRANKIDLAADLLHRFLTKFCSGVYGGAEKPSKEATEDFRSNSDVRGSGIALMADALETCKSSLLPKATRKWNTAMDKMEKLNQKIIRKNEKWNS